MAKIIAKKKALPASQKMEIFSDLEEIMKDNSLKCEYVDKYIENVRHCIRTDKKLIAEDQVSLHMAILRLEADDLVINSMLDIIGDEFTTIEESKKTVTV